MTNRLHDLNFIRRKHTLCMAIASLTIISLGMLSACATSGDNLIRITSQPESAYVEAEWTEGTCRTPCTLTVDQRVRVTVSKEGFVTQTFYVEPGGRDIFVKLELTASTESVESNELPDL